MLVDIMILNYYQSLIIKEIKKKMMYATGFQKANNSTAVATIKNSSFPTERAIVDKSVQGASKFLTRKWREKSLNMHRHKVERMRSVVTC